VPKNHRIKQLCLLHERELLDIEPIKSQKEGFN